MVRASASAKVLPRSLDCPGTQSSRLLASFWVSKKGGLGFKVQGLQGLMFKVWGSGFRVESLKFRVYGLWWVME